MRVYGLVEVCVGGNEVDSMRRWSRGRPLLRSLQLGAPCGASCQQSSTEGPQRPTEGPQQRRPIGTPEGAVHRASQFGICSFSRRCKLLGGPVTQRCASRAATSGLGLEKQAIWCGGDRARVGLGCAIWSEPGRSTFRPRARAAITGGANTVRPRTADRYMTGRLAVWRRPKLA